jgi:hypothetical protein
VDTNWTNFTNLYKYKMHPHPPTLLLFIRWATKEAWTRTSDQTMLRLVLLLPSSGGAMAYQRLDR